MTLVKKSNFSIDEIAKQLKIPTEELLCFLQSKGNNDSYNTSPSIETVIKAFIETINKGNKAYNTKKRYFNFLSRFSKFINENHNEVKIGQLNETIVYDFFSLPPVSE